MGRHLLSTAVWIVVWLFWVWLARFHHPTLQLNMLASGVLVIACAIAVHFGEPSTRGRPVDGDGSANEEHLRVNIFHWLHMAVRIVALAVVAALIITWLYNQLWGPDPLRYTLAVNLVMDATFIALHFSLAKLCSRLSASASATGR